MFVKAPALSAAEADDPGIGCLDCYRVLSSQ
jgi:hypothetical protein